MPIQVKRRGRSWGTLKLTGDARNELTHLTLPVCNEEVLLLKVKLRRALGRVSSGSLHGPLTFARLALTSNFNP